MTLWGYDLWAATLAFARIGAIVMLMPGLGEAVTPARVRLGFALILAITIAPETPPASVDFGASIGALIGEVLIGIVLGGAARMFMSALATAGQIFGIETSLSYAQLADPTGGHSEQVIGVFLGLMGVTLIFATNLHHVFLMGVVQSYEAFAPGKVIAIGDASELALQSFTDAFRIGLQIAAPVMVAGLVFRVGLGVLARLAPSIQVFFVAMPLNILGGFIILTLGLSAGMLVWLDRIQVYASIGGR